MTTHDNNDLQPPGGKTVAVAGHTPKLTAKEQRFVEAYCQCWSGAKAARKAGYSVNTAKEIGYENLTKPHIIAAIKERVQPLILTEAEGAMHLTDWARGTIAPFMVEVKENDFALTVSTPKARRNLRLIKKIKQTRLIKYGDDGPYGEEVKLEIELHDAKDAVVKSLELQGKLKGVGDTNVVIFQLPDNGR